MEPIFSTEDIVMQMPTEGALFKVNVDLRVSDLNLWFLVTSQSQHQVQPSGVQLSQNFALT